MLSSERKVYILNELEKHGTLKLKEVCEVLQASESTIRRDFEELESQNKLKRVFGGVVKINFDSVLNQARELSMDKKATMAVDAKMKLCKKCSEFVEDGECIFIDGGTTFMHMLPYLEGKHDFKAFTAKKNTKKSTVRTIHEIKMESVGEELVFTFYGDGFYITWFGF